MHVSANRCVIILVVVSALMYGLKYDIGTILPGVLPYLLVHPIASGALLPCECYVQLRAEGSLGFAFQFSSPASIECGNPKPRNP